MVIPLGLSFDDVLLIPQKSGISSRSKVSLKTEIAPNFFLEIPIIATNMDTVTGIEMAVAISNSGGIAVMPRFDQPNIEAQKISLVAKKKGRVLAAVGVRDDYLLRAQLCLKSGAAGLVLDVAHGHMIKVLQAITQLKNRFKNFPLIAGVVATGEGAEDLFKAGADTVRVGVGAGSICVTRMMAGCGVPQITALENTAPIARKYKKFVIADGGAKNSGDLVKALACGASSVVCGSLLAGTDESPGEIVERNGIIYKEYNGSTSPKEKDRQMKKHNGHKPDFKLHVEGVEALVRYKGPVAGVLDSLGAGIRSGLSYCGAKNIPELWKKAKFMQITNAGLMESRAHSVELSP